MESSWWLRAMTPVAILLSLSPVAAESHEGTWVSKPRSELRISIAKDAGIITGPGWEHRFNGRATVLDFEIGPGQRLVLKRRHGVWTGEYFHPPIRPGTHKSEHHRMAFVCSAHKCT